MEVEQERNSVLSVVESIIGNNLKIIHQEWNSGLNVLLNSSIMVIVLNGVRGIPIAIEISARHSEVTAEG